MRRPAVLVALLLALCGALAGCAGADRTSHGAADVAFAEGMIPHHAQAVEMAAMAATNTTDPQVRRLAAAIAKAQAPEIATMSGWLRAWDEKVPLSDGSMSSGDPGGAMAGMMSASEMSGLEAARGADFDRRWLRLMIQHHSGAVDQARAERAAGSYAPALELAKRIEASQGREIVRMRQLLHR